MCVQSTADDCLHAVRAIDAETPFESQNLCLQFIQQVHAYRVILTSIGESKIDRTPHKWGVPTTEDLSKLGNIPGKYVNITFSKRLIRGRQRLNLPVAYPCRFHQLYVSYVSLYAGIGEKNECHGGKCYLGWLKNTLARINANMIKTGLLTTSRTVHDNPLRRDSA